MASVAILGAGPSGLAACKTALELGMKPIVFEAAEEIGGLWRPGGGTWRSMRTNLSKHTCCFSDHPWPAEAATFPTAEEVHAYLHSYRAKFFPETPIRTSTRVVSATPRTGGGWTVVAEAAGAEASEDFDSLVVCTGIFSDPKRPDIPGVPEFKGKVMHSSEFQGADAVEGGRVLVVGGAFSGAEIAVELAGAGKHVDMATRRKVWPIPRFLPVQDKTVPVDLVFYSRAARAKNEGLSPEQAWAQSHSFFEKINGGNPGKTHHALEVDIAAPPYVAITDGLLEAVEQKKISPHGSLEKMDDAGRPYFAGETEPQEAPDVVILATGYKLSLSFLPAEIRKEISFDADDLHHPVLLHKSVFHPAAPAAAFVGLYRGPYFATMELQARWALGVLSGSLPAPTPEDMSAGIAEEAELRSAQPRPQFPKRDYVGMCDEYAQLCGCMPPIEELPEELVEKPLLPFHYRLAGPGAKREEAETAMRAVGA